MKKHLILRFKLIVILFILLFSYQCDQLPAPTPKPKQEPDYLLNSSAYEKARENSRDIKKIKVSYLKQNEYIDSLFFIIEVLTKELKNQKKDRSQLEEAFSNDLNFFRNDYKSTSDSLNIEFTNTFIKINNKIRILEDRASYTDSTNFEILNMLVMFENKISSLTDSYREISELQSSGALQNKDMTDSEYREKYIDGLSLYQNSDYNRALKVFEGLLDVDKSHDLADNSQYWLGEIFYGMKDYRRSIKEFEKVFKFKDSNKYDDSQYKLGLCYINIGNKSRAKDEFQKLLDSYPNSEYYQKSRQWLEKL